MTSDFSPAATNVADSYCIITSSYDDEKMIETAAAGLSRSYYRLLNSVLPHENALTIAKFVISMKTEVNLSDHYRGDLIMVLSKLSTYISSTKNNAKPFKMMTRQDIIAFLDSFRKPDMQYLCNQAKESIKEYVTEHLPGALDPIIKRAFDILETSDDNREKLQAMELFKDTHLVKLELLSNATTIDSALNYIRNKQQEQQRKRLALDSTSNDNNNSDDYDQLTKAGGKQTVF
jgi:hypothetical protein